MATISRQLSVTYQTLTVQDLRDLVNELRDIPGNTRISYNQFRGDQREGTSLTLSAALPSPQPRNSTGRPIETL